MAFINGQLYSRNDLQSHSRMTNQREESVRKLPVFDGLFDKNAEDAGLPEGLLARLRLFWMVRIGPRLAEIR